MSLQETIAADEVNVTAAQAALDAANVQLATDQAKLAAIQPHLSILDQIESELAVVEQGIEASVAADIDAIAATIKPLLDKMRALFNGQ